jgi:hypothetical protein
MSDEHRSGEELPELGALAREAAAPPTLEERVVAALWREGLLTAPAPPRWRRGLQVAGAIAAAIAIFFAGVLVGAGGRPAAPQDFHATYALLLRTGPDYQQTANDGQETQRVEEYRAWAGGVYRSGVQIRGEKLGDAGRLLRKEAESPLPEEIAEHGPGRLGGFFLISAGSLEEAVSIARTCPHLRYGGTIEVRPIDPT